MLPREKLKHFGVNSLNLDELFALLLGVGGKKKSVFRLASEIVYRLRKEKLITYRGLTEDFSKVRKVLDDIEGLGEISKTRILASLEFARRIIINNLGIKLLNSYEVLKVMHFLRRKKQEHFYALYIDRQFHLINVKKIASGGMDWVSVGFVDIFRWGIELSAYGFFIVHNHPTGKCAPSQADIVTTRELYQASKLVGLLFVDHIIIGPNCYYSFVERKMM